MQINHHESETKGMFYIGEKKDPEAEMSYSKAGDTLIIIDHTTVSETLKGKGAGKQLVAAAVAYAREKKVKVLPLCPFTSSVFDKVAEYRDVLHS
jgi:uncharacterized protein